MSRREKDAGRSEGAVNSVVPANNPAGDLASRVPRGLCGEIIGTVVDDDCPADHTVHAESVREDRHQRVAVIAE